MSTIRHTRLRSAADLLGRALGRAGAREGQRAIDALFEVAPDPMLLVDDRGTIVRANEQLAALAGWSLDELIGAPVDSLVPVDRRAAHAGQRAALLADGGSRPMSEGVEVELLRADGVAVPVEIALAVVALGRRRFVVSTVRDATAHRESMAMLVRLESMRRLFLSAVSHELRTPLTVVKGMGDTLLALGDRLDGPTREDVIRRLVGAAERLDTLLSDLLNLQRLEQGDGLASERVSPGAIADQAAVSAEHNGLTAHVEVVGDPPSVLADPVLLNRGVANLLSNARKYAPGPVEVTIEAVDGGTTVRVEDHGPGVPAALRGEVFQPFSRGTATDSATPGVGIGLSLVAGLAASAGGRAWATDREDGGAGASFRIWLPGAPPLDRRQGPVEGRRPDGDAPAERRDGPRDRRGRVGVG